jgi:pyruvate ferredoxin oxidoreductase alpha subunit
VDAFLPPFEPVQVLDPDTPMSIGAMVGPEAFTEVRYLAHHKQLSALELIPQIDSEFQKIFGRASGGLIRTYHAEDADTVVVSLGSVIGTIKDVVDELRDEGVSIGVLAIRSFRPFPTACLREALKNAKRVVVIEKSMALGMGGIVSTNLKTALERQSVPLYSVIAGLGGRSIGKRSLRDLFAKAVQDELEGTHLLDLDWEVVNREIEREKTKRRSGAIAENILRDVGVIDAAGTL